MLLKTCNRLLWLYFPPVFISCFLEMSEVTGSFSSGD